MWSQRGQSGFFGLDESYRRPSETVDPLARLASPIDFEVFRPQLNAAQQRSEGSRGRRAPYDPVLMFGILILQTPDTLSDDATDSTVWADTAYRSAANDSHLARNGMRSLIHVRRRPGADLTPALRKANRARSKVRSAVATIFAADKHVLGLIARTIGIGSAHTKIGPANPV